jgi:hypothetical protein
MWNDYKVTGLTQVIKSTRSHKIYLSSYRERGADLWGNTRDARTDGWMVR